MSKVAKKLGVEYDANRASIKEYNDEQDKIKKKIRDLLAKVEPDGRGHVYIEFERDGKTWQIGDESRDGGYHIDGDAAKEILGPKGLVKAASVRVYDGDKIAKLYDDGKITKKEFRKIIVVHDNTKAFVCRPKPEEQQDGDMPEIEVSAL